MELRDSVDEHLDRWLPVLPHLDPDIEGIVTRMARLVAHLSKVKERSLVEYHLQEFEFSTLQALAAHQGRAVPTELVADLRVSPATMTGRLDTLEHRGFVRRKQSSVDRRRVDVELTAAGYRAWRSGVDAVGVEEHRILETLPVADRQRLSDLLRRLLAAAEIPDRAGGK
jgi:DNA-binding MarR family transcriptional regulator